MHRQQVLVGFQRGFVLSYQVLRHADLRQFRAECGEATHDHYAFQRTDQWGHEGTGRCYQTEAREQEYGGCQQQPLDAAPERTGSSRGLDAVTGEKPMGFSSLW